MLKFIITWVVIISTFVSPTITVNSKTIDWSGMVTLTKPDTPQIQKQKWTEKTHQKLNLMLKIWFEKEFATYIINKCAETSKDPKDCIQKASMIAKAESNAWKNKNVFWLMIPWIMKLSKTQQFDQWVKRYNAKWYKNLKPSDFYPPKWKKSKTNYCASEKSSNSSRGCPNGLKIATLVYNQFESI